MPRADFACSGKCKVDGAATVYEDLPLDTKRCPVCGSKRVQRLFNAINVATRGTAKFVDNLVGPEYERQKQQMDTGKAARVEAGRNGHPAVVAGPASQMGALLARATGNPAFGMASAGQDKPATQQGAVLGNAFPRGGVPHEVGRKITGRPRPKPGSFSWNG